MNFESFWRERRTGLLIGIAAIGALLGALFLAFIVGRAAYLNAKLRNVCPEYFSLQHAFVVSPDGIGLDSVAVEMRDNSNFNTIYRTFTDSSGKFVLFNDFGSFALHDLPFTYEIHVSANGFNDTVLYKFQRHRLCHFRRIEGPDTIVFDRYAGSSLQLKLVEARSVPVDQLCTNMPWEQTGLSSRPPDALKSLLHGWSTVRYGTLEIGEQRLPFAFVKDRLPDSSGSTDIIPTAPGYLIDHNGNGHLRDEVVRPWLAYDSGEADCTVRSCSALDTIVRGASVLPVQLRLRDVYRTSAVLQYRQADAIIGKVKLEKRTYDALLWDRSFGSYSDLRNVTIGIDLDRSGNISCFEGSRELKETALFPFAHDSVSFVIDTISADGQTWYCSAQATASPQAADALPGSWAADFAAVYNQALSLYQECAANDAVVLYFFEGNAAVAMEDLSLSALIHVLQTRIGSVRLIGVNRRVTGSIYTDAPVIDENLGWRGPIVSQFHNFRDREVVVIDRGGTVLCRGEPGRSMVQALLESLGRKDIPEALLAFDNFLAANPVIGESRP